jgi:hypothetical protein
MNPTTPYYQPQQFLYAIWVFTTILLDNFTTVSGGGLYLCVSIEYSILSRALS